MLLRKHLKVFKNQEVNHIKRIQIFPEVLIILFLLFLWSSSSILLVFLSHPRIIYESY